MGGSKEKGTTSSHPPRSPTPPAEQSAPDDDDDDDDDEICQSEEEDAYSFIRILEPEFKSLAEHLRDITYKISGIELTEGQRPIIRYVNKSQGSTGRNREVVSKEDCDLEVTGKLILKFCRKFRFDSHSGRAGVPGTLHRIARMPASSRNPTMLTLRLGRRHADNYCKNMMGSVCLELWKSENATARSRSLLLIGPPGSGKTTALREIARVLSDADGLNLSVVVLDTMGEIGGSGPSTLCGLARCISVPSKLSQHHVMLSTLESHHPDVIIVDEISTLNDARAVERITTRGVAVVCAAHATGISDLMMNEEMKVILGQIKTNPVSDGTAHFLKSKNHTARTQPSCFQMAIVITDGRYKMIEKLNKAIDTFLTKEYANIHSESDPFSSSRRKRHHTSRHSQEIRQETAVKEEEIERYRQKMPRIDETQKMNSLHKDTPGQSSQQQTTDQNSSWSNSTQSQSTMQKQSTWQQSSWGNYSSAHTKQSIPPNQQQASWGQSSWNQCHAPSIQQQTFGYQPSWNQAPSQQQTAWYQSYVPPSQQQSSWKQSNSWQSSLQQRTEKDPSPFSQTNIKQEDCSEQNPSSTRAPQVIPTKLIPSWSIFGDKKANSKGFIPLFGNKESHSEKKIKTDDDDEPPPSQDPNTWKNLI